MKRLAGLLRSAWMTESMMASTVAFWIEPLPLSFMMLKNELFKSAGRAGLGHILP